MKRYPRIVAPRKIGCEDALALRAIIGDGPSVDGGVNWLSTWRRTFAREALPAGARGD